MSTGGPRVLVVNRSTVVTDADAERWTAALQRQVTEHFRPVWDLDATLYFGAAGSLPGAWEVTLVDRSDQAGALGYHDEGRNGLPYGIVAAQDTLQDGGQVSVTLSHEVLELLADPYVRLGVLVQTVRGGRVYAYETADPVEEDTYQIDGVAVSNFVTQHWFDPGAKGVALDYLGHLQHPFQLAKGGYMSVFHATSGKWGQVTARYAPASAHDLEVTLPAAAARHRRSARRTALVHQP